MDQAQASCFSGGGYCSIIPNGNGTLSYVQEAPHVGLTNNTGIAQGGSQYVLNFGEAALWNGPTL
jgi:hypothetical protein